MSEAAVCGARCRRSAVGDTVAVMRRRLAVTAVAVASLVGEWLGHGAAYYRVAGIAGLQAGLTGGIHDFMLPLGLALLLGAAAGATAWTRAWLALGRRLDRSGAALRLLRSRDAAAQLCEHLVRALWERNQRRTSSPLPRPTYLPAAQLLLRSAIWQRPPPVPAAA